RSRGHLSACDLALSREHQGSCPTGLRASAQAGILGAHPQARAVQAGGAAQLGTASRTGRAAAAESLRRRLWHRQRPWRASGG
ncbi:unnamed protein product, partial [Symbiodinium microadriaticum]